MRGTSFLEIALIASLCAGCSQPGAAGGGRSSPNPSFANGGSGAVAVTDTSPGGTDAATSGGGGASSAATNSGGTAGVSSSFGGAGTSGSGGTSGSDAAGGAASGCVVVPELASWPDGKSPADIGKLAVADFANHTGEPYDSAGYSLVLSWQGSLRFNILVGAQPSNATLIQAFDPYLNGTKTVPNDPSSPGHPEQWVDKRLFGVLPLEIFLITQDPRYLELGIARPKVQWQSTTADGITSDARYWIDDMYMITGLELMGFRATKDPIYLTRATSTMRSYLPRLQKTPDGNPGSLFWHVSDGSFDSKAYWGRANGWVASGMTEMLLELPAGEARDEIMTAYKRQLDALLPLQIRSGNDAGCWRQVLDMDEAAPAETSCTAMFTFALVTGIKRGWLTDPQYVQAARAGWLALADKVNRMGQLGSVCPGTSRPTTTELAEQQQFYVDRMKDAKDGDQHGQAGLMWAARALLDTECARGP